MIRICFSDAGEMQRIKASLSGLQSVSIVGERRIGKSSVANRIYHALKADEKMIAVFLDFDSLAGYCDSENDFFKALNDRFLESFKEKPAIELDGYYGSILFDKYPAFRKFVETHGKRGLQFVIINIDEFEHLPEKPFASDSFFSNLRAIGANSTYRLAFVTISRKKLKDLTHRSIQSSSFWNIFNQETIGLLDGASIQELRTYGFTKNAIPVLPEETEKMEHYAGAFPFFNQMVCEHLFNAKVCSTPADWNSLEVEFLPYFQKLWENRTGKEQKLLKQSANGRIISVNFMTKEMQTRGILKSDCRPFSDFFRDVIQKEFKIRREYPKWITYEGIKGFLKDILSVAKDTKEIIKK